MPAKKEHPRCIVTEQVSIEKLAEEYPDAESGIERIPTTEMLYLDGHEFSPINIPNFMIRDRRVPRI